MMRYKPFIDKILDDELKYHECYFNKRDGAASSIAGAAHLKGTLVSFQGAAEFEADRIQVSFSVDGEAYQDIDIPNLTDERQVSQLRRHYVPSPKHALRRRGKHAKHALKKRKPYIAPMDLDDETAQTVLDNGIQSGKQVYGYHSGKFYTFQPDNVGGYHGYPISRIDVPANVLRQMHDKSYF